MHITRQAWRKVPGGSRRGKLIWGTQLYFPRTAVQWQEVEEGGTQGEACSDWNPPAHRSRVYFWREE